MSLTNLSVNQLRSIISLLEKKEQLEGEIAKVQLEINSFTSGAPVPVKVPAKRGRKPGTKMKPAVTVEKPAAVKPAKVKAAKAPKAAAPAKAGKRSSLKDSILSILEKAGAEGVAVLDIASQLRAKPGGIHVWFSTTGKKSPEIVKVAPGKYAIKKK